jgi:hypothetical protein
MGCRKKKEGKPPAGPAPVNPGGGGVRSKVSVDVKNRLTQIGLAYQTAAIDGPVSGPQALAGVQLKDSNGQAFEIVWNVNFNRLGGNGSEMLLAWQSVPDETNGRWVLKADCKTVEYLADDVFQKTAKARASR